MLLLRILTPCLTNRLFNAKFTLHTGRIFYRKRYREVLGLQWRDYTEFVRDAVHNVPFADAIIRMKQHLIVYLFVAMRWHYLDCTITVNE